MTPHTRRPALVTAAAIGVVLALAAATRAQDAAAPGPIVSMAWLAAHLGDPAVAIIATGGLETDFERAHIPGARFVPHQATLGADHGLLSPAAFADVMARAGVSDSMRIVLYGDEPTSTGWLFMNLAAAGHADRTVWLDGNVEAWRETGYEVATGHAAPPSARGTFSPAPDGGVVVDAAWVRARLDDPTVRLLDVRSEREWAGGRIPGATPVLWQDLYRDIDTGRLKDETGLRRVLEQAGLRDGQTVVTYCAIGMRASLMYFAARALGIPARVYVGSWNDWRSRRGFPISRRQDRRGPDPARSGR